MPATFVPFTFAMTEKELSALQELSAMQDLSPSATLRAALRHYQMAVHKERRGFTQCFLDANGRPEERPSLLPADLLPTAD